MRNRHTVHPDDKRAIGHYDIAEDFERSQWVVQYFNCSWIFCRCSDFNVWNYWYQ